MLEVLEKLLVLQADDQRARQCQRELEAMPRERKAIKEKLLAAQAEFEAGTQGLKQNELDRKKLELEVQTKVTAVQKYKQQMLQTRKNEEFQALGKEIAAAEAVVGDLETRELELMEAADLLQVQVKVAKEALESTHARLEQEARNLIAREAAVKKQLEELQARRADIAAKVDENILSTYERILVKKGDSAVVPLNNEICGGCHMKVTATTAGNTKAGQEVIHCENCGRILYPEY